HILSLNHRVQAQRCIWTSELKPPCYVTYGLLRTTFGKPGLHILYTVIRCFQHIYCYIPLNIYIHCWVYIHVYTTLLLLVHIAYLYRLLTSCIHTYLTDNNTLHAYILSYVNAYLITYLLGDYQCRDEEPTHFFF